MRKSQEEFNLVFVPVNVNMTKIYLTELIDRFEAKFPESGILLDLHPTAVPLDLYVMPVELECLVKCTDGGGENFDPFFCFRFKYCPGNLLDVVNELFGILDDVNGYRLGDRVYFVCLFEDEFKKGTYGTLMPPQEVNGKKLSIIPVTYNIVDATLSTIFRQLYALLVEDNDLHDIEMSCSDIECFINNVSSSLTCCDTCKTRLELAIENKQERVKA